MMVSMCYWDKKAEWYNVRLQLGEVKQQIAALVTGWVTARENHCCCASGISGVIWQDPSWGRKSR